MVHTDKDSKSEGPGSSPALSSTSLTTQSVFRGAHPDDLAITSRESIDSEIATLEARIVSLKIQNAHTAIARLPLELMQEIFVIISRSAGYLEVGKAALSVTWVCHSWREVAHGTSELWNYIDFSNPTWVEVALSRTQNRPLYLSFDFKWEDYADANHLLAPCLQQLARIKIFSVSRAHTVGSKLDICLSPLWNSSAPLLVELTLHSRTIPTNLTPEIFPKLERLSLTHCKFSWESLPIRVGLKTLLINHPGSRISAEDLLERLWVVSPTLESLTLSRTLLNTTATPRDNLLLGQRPQKLNKIEYFEMRDDHAPPITFILDHILLPSHVDAVKIFIRNGGVEQFETVRALVSCRGLESWPIETFEFDLQYDMLVLYLVDSNRRSIHLSLDKLTSDPRSLQPIFDILPSFPMRTLTLSGNALDDHVSALLANFNASRTIERIEVVQVFVPTFTSIIYNQNQRIREVVKFKDARDIGKKMDSKMRARCRSIITFHKLSTLEYYRDFDADFSGITMDQEDYEEDLEGGFNPWWCSAVLSDENGRLSRTYFEILGLGVSKLLFNGINVPSRKYLERLCRDVQVECIDVVHVTDKKMRVFAFKTNPNA
ncbi:hypothetical protein BDN72DRAFT_859439 [Pluteus cervinus]|uniref:Uncharacterized protein n=1 Tax=Pluteus cervinus TaxID=181527 RepID=A0ACD3AQA6_9AGAR|nr:hypothetical protein BDN72DRAFT_859439 [Pluteus cervinus]